MINDQDVHPGSYVKKFLKRKKLSITKAAEILKITRPALNNFLNAKADLSTELAIKLEKAFGDSFDKKKLLEMQSSFNVMKTEIMLYDNEAQISRYNVGGWQIKANQIAHWASADGDKSDLEARSKLAVFIRKLVKSTSSNLKYVNFPAYENSQRAGWDGEVQAERATQWIPIGHSCWELGTDRSPEKKAEDEYKKRTSKIPKLEMSEITFIFVTPRSWDGAEKWAKLKRDQNDGWADVRVYDASSLEQWLEESSSAQIWFLEQNKIPTGGSYSVEECWDKWSKNTKIPLNKTMFNDAVKLYKNRITVELRNGASKPIIVSADSHGEGLAFLSCVFEEEVDNTIIIKSPECLHKITSLNTKYNLIIASPEVEKEISLSQFYQHFIVIVKQKNEVLEEDSDVMLDLPSVETFKNSLIEMGLDEDAIDSYKKSTGLSPTILRRILAQLIAEKYPSWYKDKNVIQNLIPLVFVGSWNMNNQEDKEVLKLLFDEKDINKIDKIILNTSLSDPTLIWKVGNISGIKSKRENLFLVKNNITNVDIDNFLFIAKLVLGEQDPALELSPEKRHFSSLYGKTRDHSLNLREGICDTLILLSIYGNEWFSPRDIKSEIDKLIERLLDSDWLSHKNDFTKYAESAPDKFLDILEKDLKKVEPAVLSLLKPEKNAFLGICNYANLLWALEMLAWNPEMFPRVSLVLGQLSKYEINDGYVNKPIDSLKNIYRSWMPQTKANLEQRQKTIELLIRNIPSVAWEICMDQFHVGSSVGNYTHRPKWRSDAAGYGQKITNEERYNFVKFAIQKSLNWGEDYEIKMMRDLIEKLQVISPEYRQSVWGIIKKWSFDVGDEEKAKLREHIRRYAFVGSDNDNRKEIQNEAKAIYEFLNPQNVLWRNYWLFIEGWINESINEIKKEIPFEERERQIKRLRVKALLEIKEEGIDTIKRLLEISNCPHYIGILLAEISNDLYEIIDHLSSDVSSELELKINSCIEGILTYKSCSEDNSFFKELISKYSGNSNKDKLLRIILNSPFSEKTWNLVENLPKKIQEKYWGETKIRNYSLTDQELNKAINQLVIRKRPLFAFSMARFPQNYRRVDSQQLIILLKEVAISKSEKWGEDGKIESYDVEEILKDLSKRPSISEQDLADLEIIYAKMLEHTSYGLPNVEKIISKSPQFFVQILSLVFSRMDKKDDSSKWLGGTQNSSENVTKIAFSLLENIKNIPSSTDNGDVIEKDLRSWIKNVREMCKENDRAAIGDQYIGKILSKSKTGRDGIWPCEEVRGILEDISSDDILKGICVGINNSRGAVFRGKGGEQEIEIAEKYKSWQKTLMFTYPYVSKILKTIADNFEALGKDWDRHDDLKKHTEVF